MGRFRVWRWHAGALQGRAGAVGFCSRLVVRVRAFCGVYAAFWNGRVPMLGLGVSLEGCEECLGFMGSRGMRKWVRERGGEPRRKESAAGRDREKLWLTARVWREYL